MSSGGTALQVRVDMMLCEGHGVCALAAPQVFELDDDDNLTLLQEHPGAEMRDAVREAEVSCPKRAITVSD